MKRYFILNIPGKKTEHVLITGLTYRNAVLYSGIDYMLREIHVNGHKLTFRSLNNLVQPDDKIAITFPPTGSGPKNEIESKTQSE